ncbi:MAG: VapC toxin family PIN domain ribonuclease [Hydrogenophilales bacterium CG_4_9_14_3_um_filter_59_35]|nr:MAG: VapC toxin family PIN domain ribonuclease [Hydrogenophilales bacterium CG18_big_fil_WC_8_21_14_2_50_58_12]PIY01566.1 MAG: VapC toxin family PIN domain ribonuclease [Hydrogenophilales bacterium CG_4_10_14_3_um_filter_58_23]PJB07706.1 MAG: VapC toxin family PIN domain ribonuclease [Hydrogenophilales bacterium CG_4_9_14_3_um_filter_59_35]
MANSTAKNATTVPAFVDTNVAIYAFGTDGAKIAAAEKLLSGKPTISAQVVNEFLNICRVKLGMDLPTRHALARELIAGCRVVPVDTATVKLAMNIAERHSVSHWDALIVAAALLAGCDTLYSEDMQHGQVFEGQLTVVNPFLP